jgi:hypothetical protein
LLHAGQSPEPAAEIAGVERRQAAWLPRPVEGIAERVQALTIDIAA